MSGDAATGHVGAPNETEVRRLVAAGVLHEPWTEAMGSRYRSRAEAVLTACASRWLEADITAMLSLLDGDAQQAVVQVLCEAAGVPYRPGLFLVEGSDFRRYHPVAHADRRNIDLVVIDKDWAPIIAIEAKFNAACNGRTNYCSDAHAGWSNQLVCYLHGCTHPALDIKNKVKFLWLSLDGEVGTELTHVRGAVTPRDAVRYPWNKKILEEALERQTAAMPQWRTVSWAALYDSLRSHVPEHAEALIGLLTPVQMKRV